MSPIITGYNWYAEQSKSDRIITFSHIHETESYMQDMLADLAKLGYDPDMVKRFIREKAGAFLHDLEFETKDESGLVLAGLKVRDIRVGEYINLKEYQSPLMNHPEFMDAEGQLIAEDQGWELDLPFYGREELIALSNLFLNKSGRYLFDEKGNRIFETEEERQHRKPWTDSYRIPVLLLGETALKYASDLPQFITATKIALKEGSNEISFVVHRNLECLRSLPNYKELVDLGFEEEGCLGNRPFIMAYVDKHR